MDFQYNNIMHTYLLKGVRIKDYYPIRVIDPGPTPQNEIVDAIKSMMRLPLSLMVIPNSLRTPNKKTRPGGTTGCDITFTRQNATYDRLELSYLVG